MRTFCGLTGYRTLPNKFKSSAYSPSKATKNKEQPQTAKTSIFSLPPRPKVSRSFSFSDSETASKGGKHQEHHHHQHQNKNEKVLGRTQSVYGLQTSQPLSWIDSLTSSSTYPTCQAPPDTIPRSHSLVSLQHQSDQTNCSKSGRHHSSNGHLNRPEQATASIWSRARSESFRNLRDLADREKSGSAWSLVNKTLSPLLTKVEPPKVPARTKKLKTSSSLKINEQGQETETKVVQANSLEQQTSLPPHSESEYFRSGSLKRRSQPHYQHSPSLLSETNPYNNRMSSFTPSSVSSLPTSAPASPSVLRNGRTSFISFQDKQRKDFSQHSVVVPESISSWLSSLGYDCYTPLFLSAGYDLYTVSRMTPEDLTAVGVQLPQHRHKIMTAVNQLQQHLGDGLPDFVPSSLPEWLKLIRLESHTQALMAQGYTTIEQMLQISVEDLEDIGFYKLGHQKRLLLAIKKVKEILLQKHNYGSRRSLFSHPHHVPEINDETPVSMPEPMQPLHNPLYLNTLAPYLDSLALSKTEDTYSPKNKTFANTFQSLPPKSKPVAKVPANSRIRRISENQYNPDSSEFSSKSSFTNKPSEFNNHSEYNNSKSLYQKYPSDANSTPIYSNSPSEYRKSSEFSKSVNYKTPSIDDTVTYTNIPITKISVNGHRNNVEIKDCNDGPAGYNDATHNMINGGTNVEEMTKSENYNSDQKPLQRDTRARTRSTGDVLEDIGFMLSDLTCELDKMLKLEEETRD